MPGVLVESSASSPHCFFPFEPSVPHSSCPDNSHGGLGNISSSDDPRPHSPHSPVPLSNHLSHLDILARSPPSPASYTSRELAQRLLLRSNLGPPLSAPVTTDFSIDSSSEFGVPIPSPRKGLYCTANSSDAMVGSPLLSEPNGMGSPVFSDAFSALQKFLPSNTDDDDDAWRTDTLPAMDNFSCDDFRMYEFKVRRCMRGRSHDWTECPFAHPGEKARRRDPRRFHYSGTACPDFRKGACKRGDACEYAHGVFECWLHPARYRTQPCKDGRACRRRVCFFAHTVEQLRILPSVPTASSSVCLSVGNGVESPCKMLPTQETNPLRLSMNTNEYNVSIDESPVSPHLQKILENRSFGSLGLGFSPSLTAALQGVSGSSSPILSPPISPSTSPPTSTDGFWTARLVPTKSPLSNVSAVPGHRRHLNRLQTMPTISIPQDSSELSDTCAFEGMSFSLPASAHMQYSRGNADEILHSLQALQLQSRNAEMQRCSSTPSSPHTLKHSAVQHSSVGQCRYRSIPSTPTLSSGIWDVATSRVSEDEPALRVESGRSLRAEIYGKIGKDNGVSVCGEVPDLGWVNELVK